MQPYIKLVTYSENKLIRRFDKTTIAALWPARLSCQQVIYNIHLTLSQMATWNIKASCKSSYNTTVFDIERYAETFASIMFEHGLFKVQSKHAEMKYRSERYPRIRRAVIFIFY